MTLLLALLGLIIGLANQSLASALIGALAGAALGVARTQRKRGIELEDRTRSLAHKVRSVQRELEEQALLIAELRGETPEPKTAPQPESEPRGASERPRPVAEQAPVAQPAAPSAAREFVAAASRVADAGEARDADWPGTRAEAPSPNRALARVESSVDNAGNMLRELLTGGNTVVRVGLLVLLVGVVLLLKYAADHAMFPIELRMASAALIGFGLIAFGLWQRDKRPGFGRTLQGGGVAALYLVVFFSFRVYDLIPAPLAFGLLAAIACFSGVLAVLQDSQTLIVIGVVGGFLAPVLASTGEGNHVALFSYYLVLNLLIVAVAWFKSWRPLNLLGFAFTFGIGSTWGALRYSPEDFASTEPFLISFFLLYVLIVVLFAWRRPAQLRGWVDGSLTFGTPLAALALQYAMVKDMPFGMAYTTLAMAAIYVGVATFLFKRAPELMRNLVEAFLVLGVGFATLAVPYGFSNQSLTGATWAVEGLGLFWLGIRQQRLISRLAGLLLQPLAAGALLVSLLSNETLAEHAVLNAPFAAFVLISLSGMGVAFLADRHGDASKRAWSALALFIPWSVVWWYGAVLRELVEFFPADSRLAIFVLVVAISGLLYELVGRRLRWRNGRLPSLLSAPLMTLLMLQYGLRFADVNTPVLDSHSIAGIDPTLRRNPLSGLGLLAWPVYVLGMYYTLVRFTRDNAQLGVQLHALALWSLAIFVAMQLGYSVRSVEGIGSNWAVVALGAGLLLVHAAASWLRERVSSEDWRASYLQLASGGLALAIALWHLRTNIVASGALAPVPYWPLFNALDVTLGLAFVACWSWTRAARLNIHLGLGILAFLWFNGMLARTVHNHLGVHYEPRSLWQSTHMQVAMSVSWTLIGLTTILGATRARSRSVWFAGGLLLAVVVGKLFLVDLAHLSPVAKIGTFLVVGLLLLVVGYFSPVPPSSPSEQDTSASEDLS